jgi:hypothetical protein
MNRYWRHVAILLLAVCLVQGAFASISVSPPSITPATDLISGQTAVRSTFTINFPASGGETFNSENTLQLSTELDSPTWTYILVLDGVDNPSKTEVGTNININGWILSYPSKRELSMKVTLEGTAPSVTGSEEKIIVRVRELGSSGVSIAPSEVVRKKLVINPAQIQQSITSAGSNLASLRSQIDQLAIPGLDLSAVEQKYSQADAAIQNAQKTSDYSKAAASLAEANKAISDAQVLIQQLNVQKVIDSASSLVEQTDEIITYLKVNKSMESDSRLSPIITKRERAADLIVDARDSLSEKEYDGAISKGNEAITKGQEALTDAEALKKQVDSNPLSSIGNVFGGVGGALPGGILMIVAVVVIVVVAVIGVILFRRRRHWDELG